MALSVDDFVTASQRRYAECSISTLLKALKPKDRAVLETALADKAITHSAIERVLSREGRKIGQTTIARHRRGECACGR